MAYLEVWKDISGFERYYQISNLGNIKSLNRYVTKSNGQVIFVNEKILSKKKNDRGYLEVKLSKNGKGGYYKVHRLVATEFLDNPQNKPEVNHKDCNKENNYVNNLEWVTHSENQKHAHKNGLYTRIGESNSCNKVVEKDVVDIRIRKKNKENLSDVYHFYKNKISIHQFKNIWYGYQWKHIKI